MNKRLLSSVAALLAGAGMAAAEPPVASVIPSVRPAGMGETILVGAGGPGCGAGCDTGCAMPAPHCEACGPEGRFWFEGDYLLWWVKNGRVPPLVTTGTPASAGALVPGSTVLFGGDSALDYHELSGARFTAGVWLDDCNTTGIEASYFFLGAHSTDFTNGSSGAAGSSLIARPFFNTATGLPDAELVAFPGLAAGTVKVHSRSQLQGAELNELCNLCCTCDSRVDLLAGFRWLELREGLSVAEDIAVAPGVATFGGDRIRVFDSFNTRNDFYGGQVGIKGEYRFGKLFVDGISKVALGDTHQVVDIAGATSITTAAGATTVLPGGLLALNSNIGHYTRDRFSVVPEETIQIGYQVTDHLRASIGYTFLYWSNVVRPGDQIDPVLNPNRVPTSLTFGQASGPARPAFSFHDTDFWAQGINLGLEFRY